MGVVVGIREPGTLVWCRLLGLLRLVGGWEGYLVRCGVRWGFLVWSLRRGRRRGGDNNNNKIILIIIIIICKCTLCVRSRGRWCLGM